MDPQIRKIRFVCVSDTHNASPTDGVFKLPTGDVLIHAGDLTKQGTYDELKKTLEWIDAAEFKVKIIVAGTCFLYLPMTVKPPYKDGMGRPSHICIRRIFLLPDEIVRKRTKRW